MKIEKMRYEIPFPEDLDPERVYKRLEYAARNCYQSWNKMGPGSAERLLKHIIKEEHNGILEHHQIPAHVIADRGVY
jgi:thymidylate synthase ThyX